MRDYTSIGRETLIEEHKAMSDNLTATQTRCTELLLEKRSLTEKNQLLTDENERLNAALYDLRIRVENLETKKVEDL